MEGRSSIQLKNEETTSPLNEDGAATCTDDDVRCELDDGSEGGWKWLMTGEEQRR